MSPFAFLLLALATWRVSSLLVMEDGPFAVFAHVRHIVRADRPGELRGLAQLFSCVWCMSPWIALLLSPLAFLSDEGSILGTSAILVLAVLSASTIAIAVQGRLAK